MVADQIQIARQTAIGCAQTPIDAPVLERTEDPAIQRWNRKQVENVTIVQSLRALSYFASLRLCVSLLFADVDVPIERKGIPLLLVLRIIKLAKRDVRSAQVIGVAGVGFKLNLSGGVCRQHFVKSKVQFFITEFSDYRRQVNGATVANA